MKVVNHYHCKCGAVTLVFVNKENNSIKESNLESFGLSLKGSVELNSTYICNHCVNHYGLDLCECGSGDSPENCCKKGYRETLGRSVHLFEEMKFF